MLPTEEVHDALLKLYSPVELADSALAKSLPEIARVDVLVQRAQALRSLLLDAIEALRPAGQASSASASRAYDCLVCRYVSGMTVEDIAYELHLSPRQVYRDLRWGEEQLGQLLRSRLDTDDGDNTAEKASALSKELDAIARKPESVDLGEIVAASVSTLTALAARLGTKLGYQGPEEGVMVTATPGLLQEATTQAISALLQECRGGKVVVDLTTIGGSACLSLTANAAGKFTGHNLLHAALMVLEAQEVWHELEAEKTTITLRLFFPLASRLKVLVIEDNLSAFALYERYLEGTEWEPVLAKSPSASEAMAAMGDFSAIILDIMMPEADGWSVLQTLHLNPATKSIPVVICSVLQDRELGYSLGASDYLTKPLSRPQLLQALRKFVRKSKQVSASPGSS